MLDSKLTIKPFLNKRLKDKDGKFLLYARVTYNRKSNQFPYRNLVFNSDKNITQHPYKFNKDFVFSDDDFVKNEEKFIYELYEKIEPIMIFLSRLDKDDLSLLPSIITKLNKPFIKIVRHIYYHKLESAFRSKIPTMRKDDDNEEIGNYLLTHLDSFLIAEKILADKNFSCYDFFFSVNKKIEFDKEFATALKEYDYSIEDYKAALNNEITNYLLN